MHTQSERGSMFAKTLCRNTIHAVHPLKERILYVIECNTHNNPAKKAMLCYLPGLYAILQNVKHLLFLSGLKR